MSDKMKQRFSYAFGAFGHDAYYVTLSTYFMIFVTSTLFAGSDKATESKYIGIVTSLVVGIRLVEIIFDPIIGSVIDNTRTKFGKFKPWLVIGGVISGISLLVIFTNFFGLSVSNPTLYLVLFTIVFIILDSFYSFKDIAFWSMIPALSTDTAERGTLATFARFGSSLGANGTTALVVPIVAFFTVLTSGSGKESATGWFWFALIVAVLSAGSAIVTAKFSKENETVLRTQASEKYNILDVFKAIIKNDQLLWLALSYMFYAIANVATTGVLLFYFKFVIGQVTEFAMVGVISMITGIIAVPLFPFLAKLMTRRYVFASGIGLMVLSYVMFTIAGTNLWIVGLGLIFFYFPQQLIFLSVLMTITDSVEYGQWKNGQRNEAVTLSLRPLLDKLAGTFSNAIVGFVAIAAGMTGNATFNDMTASGIHTYKLYAFYIPAALMIVSLLIFMFKVTLTEKKHAKIVAELELRYSKK
ncbi:glycoside-pentoside-hexuronide (GPH):cation symporter [Leuconostoc suionicum]|uniref:glycoside-pentoside-hexuronide (GPH):cation symporter n=1 Tax=Leuconostoc suionicum TaxID=1511761 RepID=UPI0024ACD001|nr:glycoside-pentoside-hexuronide (GPH):cation symporter [Leuconostoc suionicum]MDI6681106.1 glycoside-pentoside-hexuronide (GPH):cation symporter [Leuconostoc suionicum]